MLWKQGRRWLCTLLFHSSCCVCVWLVCLPVCLCVLGWGVFLPRGVCVRACVTCDVQPVSLLYFPIWHEIDACRCETDMQPVYEAISLSVYGGPVCESWGVCRSLLKHCQCSYCYVSVWHEMNAFKSEEESNLSILLSLFLSPSVRALVCLLQSACPWQCDEHLTRLGSYLAYTCPQPVSMIKILGCWFVHHHHHHHHHSKIIDID